MFDGWQYGMCKTEMCNGTTRAPNVNWNQMNVSISKILGRLIGKVPFEEEYIYIYIYDYFA